MAMVGVLLSVSRDRGTIQDDEDEEDDDSDLSHSAGKTPVAIL